MPPRDCGHLCCEGPHLQGVRFWLVIWYVFAERASPNMDAGMAQHVYSDKREDPPFKNWIAHAGVPMTVGMCPCDAPLAMKFWPNIPWSFDRRARDVVKSSTLMRTRWIILLLMIWLVLLGMILQMKPRRFPSWISEHMDLKNFWSWLPSLKRQSLLKSPHRLLLSMWLKKLRSMKKQLRKYLHHLVFNLPWIGTGNWDLQFHWWARCGSGPVNAGGHSFSWSCGHTFESSLASISWCIGWNPFCGHEAWKVTSTCSITRWTWSPSLCCLPCRQNHKEICNSSCQGAQLQQVWWDSAEQDAWSTRPWMGQLEQLQGGDCSVTDRSCQVSPDPSWCWSHSHALGRHLEVPTLGAWPKQGKTCGERRLRSWGKCKDRQS